jgi:4-hydroxy-tetrahydrodipicolinate synthase
LIELCEQAQRGDSRARQLARELDGALSVLATFDEGPDLVLYYKYLMVLEGHDAYQHHFNPSDALSPSQREFLRSQWELFRNWWSSWPGAHE